MNSSFSSRPTLISWTPLVPRRCSTSQSNLLIRSFASDDSLASSGNFKLFLQLTIYTIPQTQNFIDKDNLWMPELRLPTISNLEPNNVIESTTEPCNITFPGYRTKPSEMPSSWTVFLIETDKSMQIIEVTTHLTTRCHGFIGVKWRIANQHLVHDCSQRPPARELVFNPSRPGNEQARFSTNQ